MEMDSLDNLVKGNLDCLDDFKYGDGNNQTKSMVKGDKNFNFLKNNSLPDSGNDVCEMNLVSDNLLECVDGKECLSLCTSFDEKNDVDVRMKEKDVRKEVEDEESKVKEANSLGIKMEIEDVKEKKEEDIEKVFEKGIDDEETSLHDEVENKVELNSLGKNMEIANEEENNDVEKLVTLSPNIEKEIEKGDVPLDVAKKEDECEENFSNNMKKELENGKKLDKLEACLDGLNEMETGPFLDKHCLDERDKIQVKPSLDKNEDLYKENSLMIDEGNKIQIELPIDEKDVGKNDGEIVFRDENNKVMSEDFLLDECDKDGEIVVLDEEKEINEDFLLDECKQDEELVFLNEGEDIDGEENECKQDEEMVSLGEEKKMNSGEFLLKCKQDEEIFTFDENNKVQSEDFLLEPNKDEEICSLDDGKEMENEDFLLDGNKKDEDMLSFYESKEIDIEKELLEEGNQIDKKVLSDKNQKLENEEFLLGDEEKEEVENEGCPTFIKEMVIKDEKNCNKLEFGTPLANRHVFTSSTPASQSTSYCTPAKTVLKFWKPSVFKRSSLFASDTELNKAGLEDTPRKCPSIIEEEDDDDDEDDFDVSLLKLEKKLSEMESELETTSILNKNCSRLEAYHKTVVAEREEDSQKLEDIMAELSSQVMGICEQKSFSQNETSDKIDEDEVMKELLEGKNDGMLVVEDIDFANEQNDTVIEIKDEKSDVNNDEDILRLTCSSIDDSVALSNRETTIVPASTSSADIDAPVLENRDDDKFVSDDPFENFDNNSWEVWKQFTNDQDRYRGIRERWRSLTIPNPNVNLTFNKRVEQLKRNVTNWSSPASTSSANYLSGKMSKKQRKRLNKKRKLQEAFQASQIQEEPACKKQKCTAVYDREIDDLLKKLESKRFKIRSQMNKELIDMAVRQEREMYECVYRWNGDHAQLHYNQTQEVGRLTEIFMQEMAQAEDETSNYVAMLRRATDEVNTFHKFYEDLDNECGSQFVTNMQLEELFDAESMVSSYAQIYGSSAL